MKVTLRETYNWKAVVLEPSENSYNKEFFSMDMDYQDVLEMLKVQVQMEALQQRLQPLYEAMAENKKMADELKVAQAELEESEKVYGISFAAADDSVAIKD